MNTAEDLYAAVTALPPRDRLRLVERIVHDLAQAAVETRPKWMDLEGAAAGLLEGEDAQAWVSRTRRESDEGSKSRDCGLPSVLPSGLTHD